MKLTRSRILWIAISTIVLPGVVAIAFIPSSVEGVYNPFSTFGCTGDQFMEMKDGRVVTYVTCAREAYLMSHYRKEPTGSVVFRLSSSPDGKSWMRAEPHLLGTRFYYLDDGKSEWKWKRFFTRKMKAHVAGAQIRDVVLENDGTRITTYDSKFNVIHSTFRPRIGAAPPAVSP